MIGVPLSPCWIFLSCASPVTPPATVAVAVEPRGSFTKVPLSRLGLSNPGSDRAGAPVPVTAAASMSAVPVPEPVFCNVIVWAPALRLLRVTLYWAYDVPNVMAEPTAVPSRRTWICGAVPDPERYAAQNWSVYVGLPEPAVNAWLIVPEVSLTNAACVPSCAESAPLTVLLLDAMPAFPAIVQPLK